MFASYLGPSAVAAWAIAGTLWDGFEMITEAIGDAAEIRCAYLLGAGYPRRAMMSAYKTLFVGMIIAVLISTFLFIAGNYIPYWLTSDPTLQAIIHSLMPFLGLGNLALSIGQLCWTILGSQGRYRLATITAFLGTCIITVPLSALFSILLDFNLQGQTAAIVMGYMISGSFNAYIVFTSDWEYLSEQLMRENKAENREDG